ncbi:hypothetical protein DFP72DRAFT_1051704 [Ephemerocybe angulata]|uniref:Uncharacterized protein n=1 Tax=Ephemerocybe angulata TaxID=980116 RepID=A0A8H6HEP1_9AGAR|nr:hypothetical protein DFP72DRAFT_1051704 [Tulosesus angulatus]
MSSSSRQNTPAAGPGGRDFGLGSVRCTSCGAECFFHPCESAKNGNKGKIVANCRGFAPDGSKCEFVRWPSKSLSPTPVPASQAEAAASGTSQPAANAAVSVAAGPANPAAPAAGTAVPAAAPKTCLTAGCKVSRIAAACTRKRCKEHCILAGGCSFKGHPAPSQPSAVTRGVNPVPAPTTPAIADDPATASIATGPETIDALPNARFTQQIAPIFTQVVQQEQEAAQAERERLSNLLDNSNRAKQTVTIYLWKAKGFPTVRTFQSGLGLFEFPWFALDKRFLSAMGVTTTESIALYDVDGFGIWTGVDVGHTMEVKEEARIFVKLESVDSQDCSYLIELSQSVPKLPHLRHDLAGTAGSSSQSKDSTAVRIKKRELSLSPPLPQLSVKLEATATTVKGSAGTSRSTKASGFATGSNTRIKVETATSRPPTGLKKEETGRVRVKIEPGTTASGSGSSASTSRGAKPDLGLFGLDKNLLLPSSDDFDAPDGTQGNPMTLDSESDSDTPAPPQPGPSTRIADEPIWPRGHYACDIVRALNDMHLARRQGGRPKGTTAAVFKAHFPGSRYVRSTCSDQRIRWNRLPVHLREEALAAMHTPPGLWENVMKNAPSLKGKGRDLTVRATVNTVATVKKESEAKRPRIQKATSAPAPSVPKPKREVVVIEGEVIEIEDSDSD